MTHYIFICFILAILGTLAVNPVIYISFFDNKKRYNEDLKKYEERLNNGDNYDYYKPRKKDYDLFCCEPTGLIIGQIIIFVIAFVFSIFFLYFGEAIPAIFSTIPAYLWIPGLILFFNVGILCIIDDSNGTCFNDFYDIIGWLFLICAIFICISISVGISKSAYDYLHPYEHITLMDEKIENCPQINESVILKEANITDGSSLKEPIYRNGKWIYPVINDSSQVSSSGYIVVNTDNNKIDFVKKDIIYSSEIKNKNHIRLYLRRAFPNIVFFGNATFQIEPETGDVYYCQFYGDYAWFRSGRNVKGAILVNASTGKYECYLMDNIPSWVTGISF